MGKDIKDKVLNKPLLNSELQALVQQVAQIQLIEQKNKAEYSRDLVEHKDAIKTMSNVTETSLNKLVGVIERLDKRIARLEKK